MPVEKILSQWRVVNQQANDAERRILEASLAYTRGVGPAPTDRDRVLAAQLREEASTLFARALGEVEATAMAARKGILRAPEEQLR